MKDRTTEFDRAFVRLLGSVDDVAKVKQVLAGIANGAGNTPDTIPIRNEIFGALRSLGELEDRMLEAMASLPIENVRAEFRTFTQMDWSAYQGCETMEPGIFEHTCLTAPVELTLVRDGNDYMLTVAMVNRPHDPRQSVLTWTHKPNA